MWTFIFGIYQAVAIFFMIISFIVAFCVALYIKKDRERLEATLGWPGNLTLGPWRWWLIVLITGVLGVVFYYFSTYHQLVINRLSIRPNDHE